MNNLRAYRVKKLLTQKDLAKASGVNEVTISYAENGLSEPGDLIQVMLVVGLGMSKTEANLAKVFPDNDTWDDGSNKLRSYRARKLMTQKDLAKASGVTQVTISFIESGLSEPINLTKQKLSKALKVEPAILFLSENVWVGNNLREYRVKKLMTQRDLAKTSGVSQVTISFIECGLSKPTDLTKKKLAKALGARRKLLFPSTVTAIK